MWGWNLVADWRLPALIIGMPLLSLAIFLLFRALAELIACLPKPLARALGETLFRILRDERGIRVDESPWAEDRLPPHLRMNFRVEQGGEVLGQGRNLRPLLDLFAEDAAPKPQSDAIADPALAAIARRKECLDGLRALLGLQAKTLEAIPSPTVNVKRFAKDAGLSLERLGRDCLDRALRETCLSQDLPADAAALKARLAACRKRLQAAVADLRRRLLYILAETARLEHAAQTAVGVYPDTLEDILDQLAWLVYDGFVAATPQAWLDRYPLILEGVADRLDRARNNPAGDRRKAEPVLRHWKRYKDFVALPKKPRHDPIALTDYRWAVESLRLCAFSPTLPPPSRPTDKTLDALWQRVLNP